MTSWRDTQRAVDILARYQGILRPPAEQPLQVSIAKVLRVFRSDLFRALLDIQECYELSLFSACKQDGTLDAGPGTSSTNQGDASSKYLENRDHKRHSLESKISGEAAQGPEADQAPRLVRVTETQTESPGQVCAVVVGVCCDVPEPRSDLCYRAQKNHG